MNNEKFWRLFFARVAELRKVFSQAHVHRLCAHKSVECSVHVFVTHGGLAGDWSGAIALTNAAR